MTHAEKEKAKLDRLLETFRKRLAGDFPPHHWNHVRVFSAYWALVETLNHN